MTVVSKAALKSFIILKKYFLMFKLNIGYLSYYNILGALTLSAQNSLYLHSA